MLDAQTIATVKATIPLLVETGPKLTAHFYDRMFAHNPELKEIFNMSNQRNGDQREALFNAIAAYASNIDNLPALLPAVEKIAQKHTSFQIKPEQYNIVGGHLLATLDEMFSPGQEVLDAWGKAYGVLANVFIHRESEIYRDNASKNGGWEGTRAFRIVKKTPRSALITSFDLEPVDGQPVADYQPGQYLAIWLKPQEFEYQEIRQYSLTRKPDGKGYRIAVKRENGGQVSNWLHNASQEGDIVHLAAPAGDFFLAVEPETPVTLISGGVRIRPGLNCRVVLFPGTNTNHAGDVKDEDFTVTDFTGLRRADNGIHAGINDIVSDHNFDFHFRQKIHHVLRPAVQFGVAFLTAKALHFRHRHPGDADFGQRFAHVIQFERFNNRINLFHGFPVLEPIPLRLFYLPF